MNKKGTETTMLETIFAIIISVFVIVVIVGLIYLILKPSTPGDLEIPLFYYQVIVNEINNLNINSVKNTGILGNEDFIFLGFSQGIKEINKNNLQDACGKIGLAENIAKPDVCQGTSCFCVCEASTSEILVGPGRLPIEADCTSEKSKCEQFKENIIGDDSCDYFLYYDASKTSREIEISKKQNDIILKVR